MNAKSSTATREASLRLQVGGTLIPGRDLYIARPEDEQLFELLSACEYANILSSRQVGKSSLMLRTALRLRECGAHFAAVDLTSLGTPENIRAYFRGLVGEVARQLKLQFDQTIFWRHDSSGTSTQQFIRFFREVVAAQIDAPVLVFLDEIDSTLKLAFTDDLFTALRAMYNERAVTPAYQRIAFCLVGVATPDELIKDRRTTPYNVGKTLWLGDFDAARGDLTPLEKLLSTDPILGAALLRRVMWWTGGHPFLTAHLCQDLRARTASNSKDVHRLILQKYATLDHLGEDVHIQQILRFVGERFTDGLRSLNLYEKVLEGREERDQSRLSHTELKLSGLVRRNAKGVLVSRNRVYRRIFGLEWVRKSQPRQDIRGLQRQVVELQAKLLAARRIETMGGAAAIGTVNVESGNFIGRDYIRIIQYVEDPDAAESAIAHYLKAMAVELAERAFRAIESTDVLSRTGPLLNEVYVPLDTTLQIPEGETLAQWLSRHHSHKPYDQHKSRQLRQVSALEALSTHRTLILLGKPGSGKSTFGAHVLLALAQAWLGQSDTLSKLGVTWTHGGLLPIRVELRRFAEQLPAGAEAASAGDLWAFIARSLEQDRSGLSPETVTYLRRIERDHGALIFFDGLDECGDWVRRGRVLNAVQQFIASAGLNSRFFLTARPYAWPTGGHPESGVYEVADLDIDHIEQFIRAWYGAMVSRGLLNQGDATRRVDDLLEVRHRPDLVPLLQNPLLLKLMVTMNAVSGRLPDDRAVLYDEAVELLLLRWSSRTGADRELLEELSVPGLRLSDLREVLQKVAYETHAHAVGLAGSADIGEGLLIRAFRPLFDGSRDKAAMVVNYFERRAGLLIALGERDGERQFAFPHRTFEEFLAACHLAAQPNFAAESARLARLAPNHWQMALILAARVAKAERGASAADELIGGVSIAEFRLRREPNAEDWSCAFLAGLQLQEIGLAAINNSARTRALAARVAGWIAASLCVHPDDGGLPTSQRACAGDLLSSLGDPRFDQQRCYLPADDMLGFVLIPSDRQFRIGTRKGDAKRVAEMIGQDVCDDELNDALTPTPDFYIGRYPVTVAQFRVFVDEAQFEASSTNPIDDPGSRPVRCVSWRDAHAYCDWLNQQLTKSAAFQENLIATLIRDHGWRVTLPTELEWEKAARGGLNGAIFSWGDRPDPNRANYLDAAVGCASAVGCFPANDFGLYDMIGNVREWTRSIRSGYPYDSSGGFEAFNSSVDRVVRGGSFFDERDAARCAIRDWEHPDARLDLVGFRVVLRSSCAT